MKFWPFHTHHFAVMDNREGRAQHFRHFTYGEGAMGLRLPQVTTVITTLVCEVCGKTKQQTHYMD